MLQKPTKLVYFLAFFTLSLPAIGQVTFEKSINFLGTGETATAAVENLSGNYVITGFSLLAGQPDVVLAELTASGDLVSSVRLAKPSYEMPNAICQAADSSYIIVGTVYESLPNRDWFIMKVDSDFNLVWWKRFGSAGNDYASSCEEISPGHYLVTGTSVSGQGLQPTSIVIDESGNILYQGYLNNNNFTYTDFRGRYLGDGTFGFSNLKTSLSIVDTTCMAIKHAPNKYCSFTRDVALAPNNSYATTGIYNIGSQTGNSIAFGILDNTLQNITLYVQFNNSGFNLTPVSMIRANSGNYFIAGNEEGVSTGIEQPIILETTASGVLNASYKILPAGMTNCGLKFMIPVNSGGYLVGGYSETGSTQNLFVASLNPDGSNCASVPYFVNTSPAQLYGSNGHSTLTGSLPPVVDSIPSATAVVTADSLHCITSGIVTPVFISDNFAVYPTIVNDHFYIEPASDNREYHVNLFDVTGKKIHELTIHGKTRIETPKFVPGIYLVVITETNTGNPVYTRKISILSDK